MIVPRSRLLWWVGGAGVPLALLAAAIPEAAGTLLAAGALLLAAPLLDAVLTMHRGGGRLDAQPVASAHLTRGVEGELIVRVRNPSMRRRRVRLGVPLPEDLGCEEDDVEVALPAGSEWSIVRFRCLPTQRGLFQVDRCYLGTASPLGFWLTRKAAGGPMEIRVYPGLQHERKKLAGLFLPRGSFGIHAHRQIGQGREFEKLRDYIPGDSYDEIHWKATAKRARPVTKVYQIERTQEVYVIIDSSRLSARLHTWPGDGEEEAIPPTSLERFLSAALILGMVAQRQQDLFGVMSFSEGVDTFVRAKGGPAHYRACRDALYTLQPRIVTPDFSEVFTFLRARLRRRALLVFLTNLDDPILSESFAAGVGLIARQHLVLANMIQPPGIAAVFSDPGVSSAEDVYARLAGHLQWQRLRELEKGLQRCGVRFRLLANESFCPQLVSQYVNVKRRQLL
ncbi:MAG TPA: DUF58 domain-containing protein [Phycisphaerae bacterium]|nr:DUF58 domain-containing protein [Phycisphaerae bacterium]